MGMYTSVIVYVFECCMQVCQKNEQIIYQTMKTTHSKMLKKEKGKTGSVHSVPNPYGQIL